MPCASDEDVQAALPLLKPLLLLLGSATLPWSLNSNRDGYTVCEIPSAPALGMPLKCFRTQFTIEADLDTFARLIVSEDTTRECDPTLRDICVLKTERRNALLHTSYISPSPWIVSPRDFCVWSTSVLTAPQQLRRLDPLLPSTAFPEHLTNDAAGTAWRSVHAIEKCSTVFLQNSRSTTSLLCPLSSSNENPAYVRGFVHCYGYAAWQDPSQPERLQVTNFCCVDACGRVPKWLVAAAVDQNTQKLRRTAHLIEAAAAAAATSTQPMKPANVVEGEQKNNSESFMPLEQTELPAPLLITSPVTAVAPSSAFGEHSIERSPKEKQHASLCTSLLGKSDTLSRTRTPLNNSLPESSPLNADASNTTMSSLSDMSSPYAAGRAATGAAAALATVSVSDSVETNPPLRSSADTSLHHMQEDPAASEPSANSSPPPPPPTPFDAMVQRLSTLARAPGWRNTREVHDIEYAELPARPQSLMTPSDEVCVALRVSATVQCSLDTMERLTRSSALAPDVDPDLIRFFSDTHHGMWRSGGGPGPNALLDLARVFSMKAAATSKKHSDVLAGTGDQLRHYQFQASSQFPQAWDMFLQCANAELDARTGGQLGFHTAGIPATTYVWVGADATSDDDVLRTQASSFRRMRVRVFGLVAVAIPRRATSLRVTQYMLFDAAPAISPNASLYPTDSKFATKKKWVVTDKFLGGVSEWLGWRLRRVRSLCEGYEMHCREEAMAPIETEPLLRFLYDVHRAVEAATAGVTETRVGDVAVKKTRLGPPINIISGDTATSTSADGVTAATGGRVNTEATSPPLYVFSTTFPCSLDHFQAYLSATSVRGRDAVLDGEDIFVYDEFPSAPNFTAVRLEYGEQSRFFSQVCFAFLETCGEVKADDVASPTLVLSRLNCDALEEEEKAGAQKAKKLPPHNATAACREEDEETETMRRQGRIYCAGWVATAIDDPAKLHDASNASPAAAASCSCTASPRSFREHVRHFASAVTRRSSHASLSSTATVDVAEKAKQLRQEGHVQVQLYVCVDVPASRDRGHHSEGLLHSVFVESQAKQLRAFRDAACAWAPM